MRESLFSWMPVTENVYASEILLFYCLYRINEHYYGVFTRIIT